MQELAENTTKHFCRCCAVVYVPENVADVGKGVEEGGKKAIQFNVFGFIGELMTSGI